MNRLTTLGSPLESFPEFSKILARNFPAILGDPIEGVSRG